VRRRLDVVSDAVMARNTGTTPIGFTTKKIAAKVERMKLPESMRSASYPRRHRGVQG